MPTKFRRLSIKVLSLAVVYTAPNVYSQDTIEEIVVTAQKRQQSLMDVGISVAVANEQEIRDRRINMMTDILLFAPATNIKENTPGIKPIISIRAVGLNDFNAANGADGIIPIALLARYSPCGRRASAELPCSFPTRLRRCGSNQRVLIWADGIRQLCKPFTPTAVKSIS